MEDYKTSPIHTPQEAPSEDQSQQGSQSTTPPCPKTWLLESILMLMCCCTPLGIVALIYAAQVESAYSSGNYEAALRNSSEARKWNTWGLIAGVTGYIVIGIFYLLVFVLALVNNHNMYYDL